MASFDGSARGPVELEGNPDSGEPSSEDLHTPPRAPRSMEQMYADASSQGNESEEEYVRDPEFEAGIVLSPIPATPTEPSPVVSPAREVRVTRQTGPNIQNLFVVRHGERSDDAIPGWEKTAPRPWDPPLTDKGFQQAYNVGRQLRNEGYSINRVAISPFIRCLQTAGQIIKALTEKSTSEDEGAQSDKERKGKGVEGETETEVRGPASAVEAHIEYGLAEILNQRAIRNPPKSGDMQSTKTWLLPEAALHALLPPGVLDQELGTQGEFPKWPEGEEECHARYARTYDKIGDQFPEDNIICVTHGEGVGVSASRFKNALVYAVNYCGYTQAQRSSPAAGRGGDAWELATQSEESGVYWTAI